MLSVVELREELTCSVAAESLSRISVEGSVPLGFRIGVELICFGTVESC